MGRITKTNIEDRKKGFASAQQMEKAMELVLKKGLSQRKAAKQYNINHQTLSRYIRKNRNQLQTGQNLKLVPNYKMI